MEEDTHCKAHATLKTKHLAVKNLQDFTTMDKEWNDFNEKETKNNPDKTFTTFDENFENLKKFGVRHEKDTFQVLGKLEVSMPEE